MRPWDTVAIVGVGLIGGSIGLALRERQLARRTIGIGRNPASLARAEARGAISAGTTDLATGVRQAEIVIVCTPVEQIAQHTLAAMQATTPSTLITDAGSTKAYIVSQIENGGPDVARFIGSHPLAGSEKSGPDAARADLLIDRQVIITPTPKTAPQTTESITRFWSQLGAHVAAMPPAEHDRIVASASHLPHVIASVLAASTPPEILRWVASGWSDTTRIAAADSRLWTHILLQNRDQVLAAFGELLAQASRFHDALQQADEEKLHELLRMGKERRDSVGN